MAIFYWTKTERLQDVKEDIRGQEVYKKTDYHFCCALARNDGREVCLHFHGGIVHKWAKDEAGRWSMSYNSETETEKVREAVGKRAEEVLGIIFGPIQAAHAKEGKRPHREGPNAPSDLH